MAETLERTQLREFVDTLPDEIVPLALDDLRERYSPLPGEAAWRPAFFGSAASTDGRTDTSVRVDEILAEGYGR
jgi:hypothetical protein